MEMPTHCKIDGPKFLLRLLSVIFSTDVQGTEAVSSEDFIRYMYSTLQQVM